MLPFLKKILLLNPSHIFETGIEGFFLLFNALYLGNIPVLQTIFSMASLIVVVLLGAIECFINGTLILSSDVIGKRSR